MRLARLEKPALALLFVLALLVLYLIPPSGKPDMTVGGGTAAWDEASMTVMPLSGSWDFLVGELSLEGWESASSALLPSTWKGDSEGCASYRARVFGLAPGGRYSILLPYQATAYSLYLDGELLASNGRVGASREDSSPGYRPGIASFAAKGSSAELVLQLSNFHHRRGGPFQTLYFGLPEAVLRLDNGRVFTDSALLLVYLTMGLYQLAFFALRKDRSIAFLALFMFFAAANAFLGTSEALIFRALPSFPWVLYQKLCYFAAYGAPASLFLFAYSLYGGAPRSLAIACVAPFMAIFALAAVTPPWVFTRLNAAFQGYTALVLGIIFAIIVSAWRRKVSGAGVVLVGFLLMGSSAVSGMFFSGDRIQGGAILPFGFLSYYRIDFSPRLQLSLSALSYLVTLLFLCILGCAYFFRHPEALRGAAAGGGSSVPGDEGDIPVGEAGGRFGLSSREIEVARLVLAGRSNKDIADELCVSLSTVKTHVSRIFRKAGAASRSELFYLLRLEGARAAPESAVPSSGDGDGDEIPDGGPRGAGGPPSGT